MARLPRFVLPGYPQHLIQRGLDQRPYLRDEADYWYFWESLVKASEKFGCAIHAYVLLPDHFHLLLTPQAEDSIGKLMQSMGRYYVKYFNDRYLASGPLWKGRYRATLLDPEAFLLTCARYLELNPVRAGLVAGPGDYDWSSYGCHALGSEDRLVSTHPCYQGLGRTKKARQSAYRALFATPLDEATLQRIRDATNKSWLLGDEAFAREIEGLVNRRTQPRQRGGDRRSLAFRAAQAAGVGLGTA
ncbi:MAG: transposase [Gammaproteobacteria bacterium]|jgi:putative transposase|nr:transposase [Gammaproteobacteria bacterium]